MDWQQGVSLGIVAITATFFVWSRTRKRKSGSICGSGCGCAKSDGSAPRETITYHARKGERAQIITRMS